MAAGVLSSTNSLSSVLLRLIVSVPNLGWGKLFRTRHGECVFDVKVIEEPPRLQGPRPEILIDVRKCSGGQRSPRGVT